MTPPTPLLELRDISYTYPGTAEETLSHVNFTLTDERIGLIGANGSGKTTFFQLIMGLIRPQSGELFFQGKMVHSEKDFQELRRTIGFLFQNSDDQLFSPTVLEDVAFGPLNMGASPDEAKEISIKTLEKLGLKDFEDRITHKLSGGEKKLTALATILSMQPKLLLLDEPSNNLDPATRERLINILRGLDQAHIIISHDMDFLASTCAQLYTIEHRQLHRCDQKQVHSHEHLHPYGDKPHQHGT